MSPTRRQAALALAVAGADLWWRAPAWGQSPAADAKPAEEDGPTKLEARESLSQHLLAPVHINGAGPFEFLLDTGANVSCVSRRVAERLALPAGPLIRVHTMVGVKPRPSVVIDRLQVGQRSRRKVRVPALPIFSVEVDGVLGVDWLTGQRLELDFKTPRIEITQSRRDEVEGSGVVVVPARKRHGQLTIVDADLQGAKISAIIDSGAQATLCNTSLRQIVRSGEKRDGASRPFQPVRLEALTGEVFQGEAVFLPFLRLGGLQLGNVEVVCADTHVFNIWDLRSTPALVIGMDLLKQFDRIALDFGRSTVRFDFV